jgi:outer membrane protein OmpA-like peptidoglycan-associated protein
MKRGALAHLWLAVALSLGGPMTALAQGNPPQVPPAAPTQPAVLPVAPTSPASPTAATPPHPSFDCVGAEQLEDDAFAIPFARGAGTLAPAADGALEALLARAQAEPSRPICILGHAGPQEGGATANTRLAARRAATVAEELARRGLPRDRLRAEIRVAAFARAAAIPAGRSVTAVLLPAP